MRANWGGFGAAAVAAGSESHMTPALDEDPPRFLLRQDP